jgi:hypothetical protein
MQKYVPTMWTENKAQIKIKKIAPMAVLYKTPLGRNQASKSKFGLNHPLLRYLKLKAINSKFSCFYFLLETLENEKVPKGDQH